MDASNITNIIISTINTMFSRIFSSIDNQTYSILDKFVFINSNILNDKYVTKLLGFSSKDGILIVANSLVFGFLLYYGFKLLFSHLGVTSVEKPSKFIFKLIVFGICMNFSFFLCDQIINLNSLISDSIRQIGENLYHSPITFSKLIQKLNSVISINGDSLDVFSLDGILKSFISFGILNLVIVYSIRYILIKIFVLISPFAFLSLSTKASSIFFRSWFKSFISLLLIQSFVSIVLLFIFSLNLSSNNLFAKFILIGSIFILIKSNSYVREMLGGINTDFSANLNNFKNIINK